MVGSLVLIVLLLFNFLLLLFFHIYIYDLLLFSLYVPWHKLKLPRYLMRSIFKPVLTSCVYHEISLKLNFNTDHSIESQFSQLFVSTVSTVTIKVFHLKMFLKLPTFILSLILLLTNHWVTNTEYPFH